MYDTIRDAVRRVQDLYPRVYHACHVRHLRRRSTSYALSERDSALLAHIGAWNAITATQLARHVGVGKPSLSAALARLVALGYVKQSAAAPDRRRKMLRLVPKGMEAMSATSVLDPARLAQVLCRLSPADRRRAVDGLALLADAATHCVAAYGRRHGPRAGRPRTEESE